jgi:succinyl-CoA synthetase alpha subunit
MRNEFFSADEKVLIQGVTGRAGRKHAISMRSYGTRIVAGVSPRGDEDVEGIPVFRTCEQAVAATGASVSVVLVPALQALEAVKEALEANIRFIVTLAEGIPVHDALKIRRLVNDAGASWIGASTPGIVIPGRAKLGFLPDVSIAPGSLGVMSKSGTLSYEVCHRLVAAGLGQSVWIGVGGDAVKGARFADFVAYFESDPATSAIVVLGEIGGSEEEELAEAIRRHSARKPYFVLITGSAAPEGVTMGHAGALIQGGVGTIQSKTTALKFAGASVFTKIQALVDGVVSEASTRACMSNRV